MVKLFRHVLRLVVAGILMAAAGFAGAQSAANYPNKPVRVVIPFAPGGAVSTIITILADRFSKEFGHNLIADYRPGADTVVGVGIATKAAADGYTLLEATSSYLVNHELNPNLPFNALKDLTPIAMIGRSSYVLTVNPSIAGNLNEFISRAKARPGELNFAYVGSVAILSSQMFMNAAGIKYTLISYKGTPLSTAAIISGEAAGSITGLTPVQPFIAAGRLKALAVTGNQRSAVLPDVPTFAEAGVKNFNIDNWFVLLAPNRTPKDIIAKLNTFVRRLQESPEMIRPLNSANIEIFATTPAEAEKFIRSEAAQYSKVIKESGLKPEGS